MDELDLQALWQEQPLDDFTTTTPKTGRLTVNYALPTSLFVAEAPRPQTGARFAVLALAATLVLSVGALVLWPAPAPLVAVPAQADPVRQLEDLLAECRTYSNSEAGRTDWPRAERACRQALELEPISTEANQLLARISVLRVCEENLEGARNLLSQGRLEETLERLAGVDKRCEAYLFRAISLGQIASAQVLKSAGADCQAYAASAELELAEKRCELYARLACQRMEPSELYPLALMKLKLHGPLDPKTEWRPRDERYLTFLKLRARSKPGAPAWQCPQIDSLRAPPALPDSAVVAKAELEREYPQLEMSQALLSYFMGNFQSAIVPLQKILENMAQAQHHAQARALLLDMQNAINLYEHGTTELFNDAPERAAPLFLQALAFDEALVLGQSADTLDSVERRTALSRRQSFLRRSIVEGMISRTYEKGRTLADREDFRAACRVWRLGSAFSRSSIDLLKALTNVCTRRAADTFERAQTCEQLRSGLDFAVEGDGFKEKIEDSLAAQQCP
ncbi:MAG: hypothetical protein Q8N23_29325 [Archangium sp.]|nr:hypothetical protein [Archangium sp.]MDP3156807.1 hypothetical protein [Archangium sp.]MDP3569655.1 hypothetical protein [Archangium sp.]